jgi:hypothetical protein
MSAGASAAAAAEAARQRQEEEEMTKYSDADLQGDWEFKILRSNLAGFKMECSPKPDPCVMRVYWPESGKETLDEKQEAQSGTDRQEAA